MMMNAFVGHTPPTMTQMSKNNNIKTHPSVRIRGTENNYNPVQCFDPSCANKNPHMHCPFCVKAESFQDPVILKAHYRVKHVDKGVEFAGLKILRCCDHCDIVGIIKGEKKFKRAHWHCYKCRNGFNRRDEAIKHYKTHFRNPQTTFQIQISQEVNQVSHLAATHTMSQDEVNIHPVLADAAILSSSNSEQHTLVTRTTQNHMTNGKSNDGTVHVSVAANETVDTSESQTIMIIKDDLSNLNNSLTTQIISSEDVSILEDKITSEKQYALLQDKYDQLALEKAQMEQDYKVEIDHLKLQIQILSRDTSNYQKREQELLSRLCSTSDKSISDMVRQMEEQYRNLLDCHLAQLRSTYLSNLPPIRCEETNTTNTTCSSDSTSTVTAVTSDSLIAEPTLLSTHQADLNGVVDYQTTAIATSIEQQQEVETSGTTDTDDLHQQRQRQEHLEYIANKVVARLQVANSHNGQVHDDIVIITSSDDHHVHQSQEEGTGNNEPLIICTSTVEEATLEETVSCHTSEPTDETTTTVVSEGDPLDGTVEQGCDNGESDAQVQVLSIIHASAQEDVAATTTTDTTTAAADNGHQNIDDELPPSKRLRTDS